MKLSSPADDAELKRLIDEMRSTLARMSCAMDRDDVATFEKLKNRYRQLWKQADALFGR